MPALPTFPTIKVPKKKPQPIPAESFERLLASARRRLRVPFVRLVGRPASVRGPAPTVEPIR